MATSLHVDEDDEGLDERRAPARLPETAAAVRRVQVPIARSTVSALGEE